MKKIFRSYVFWTYQRGSAHYDVMVTLILLFIFATPWMWDYGAKPSNAGGLAHPIEVVGDGGHGVIVSLNAADVSIASDATDNEVKRALRRAIEPVTGDSMIVERWQTTRDGQGNLVWKIWAHR